MQLCTNESLCTFFSVANIFFFIPISLNNHTIFQLNPNRTKLTNSTTPNTYPIIQNQCNFKYNNNNHFEQHKLNHNLQEVKLYNSFEILKSKYLISNFLPKTIFIFSLFKSIIFFISIQAQYLSYQNNY